MPYAGLPHPEPVLLWQSTADPYRSHSNTQRHVWLSLCGVSWCTQGAVSALWVSLVGMGFDSKHGFVPSTVLLGFLLCPWTWVSFFWWDPTFSCFMVVQQQVVILEFSQEKMSEHPPTLPFSLLSIMKQYEEAERYDTERWTLQVSRCPICC